MNIIETIRAEIERRKNNAETMRERGAYIGLLNYIDTLPEQPVEGLEEEISSYLESHYHIRYDETLERGSSPLTTFDFEDIARHFAEWGRKQVLQEIYEGKVKPADKITAAWLDD